MSSLSAEASLPSRIVCLTEETTETLYLLGEERRIVGISGYTVRPARARREKPRISAFTTARTDKILALGPDLVIGFSDIQADIARDLIKCGLNVLVFNQRSVVEILGMIRALAALVGATERGDKLIAELGAGLERIRGQASKFAVRPQVYFEEWDQPMISGIGWVSELVGIAGGEDSFTELSRSPGAGGRIIADPKEVVRRAPDIIFGSWCGKKFRPDAVRARPGWDTIPAVRDAQLFEIKSADILQPGPAALTDGVRHLHDRIAAWVALRSAVRR
ncbi:MAG: cobalamin-binding protein [Betaproteobacteria bacterium]|nr:cobalamin-binding protein [Betaproteobacteria bacterium]